MKIAFYAPLKPPDHPVPSGDRTMARSLLKALAQGGADVRLASGLRSWVRTPSDEARIGLLDAAATERDRLLAEFKSSAWRPDVWLTYHPYYKSPDLLGPALSAELAIPYATVEASFSARRATGDWAAWHEANLPALRHADVHFVMTERDHAGLAQCSGVGGRLVAFPPFIESWETTNGFDCAAGVGDEASFEPPCRLAAVAMMRRDVKLESYRFLASALGRLDLEGRCAWTLDIVGDGEARPDVERAFAEALGMAAEKRVRWHCALDRGGIGEVLRQSDLFVWPGFDEGYGLAYLEAQAMGVPVVAMRSGGVPAVVRDGETGVLVEEGDLDGFVRALSALIRDRRRRNCMRVSAIDFVRKERSLERASERLMAALTQLVR